MKTLLNFGTILLWLWACLPAYGQWKEPPETGSPSNKLPDRTSLAGQAGLGPLLIAKLIDQTENARNHKAVVEVQTDGLTIVDPAVVNHEPKFDEAHFQYRLDNDAILNTTSKTCIFEHLSRGTHVIRVALATSDNHQLGKEKTLKIHVP